MVLKNQGRDGTQSPDPFYCPHGPPARSAPVVIPAPLRRRFRILRYLGSGAEGSVYLVTDRSQGGGPLSLKVLDRPPLRTLPGLRLRLSALARIDHPNIARILDFDVSSDGSCAWIAREYVPGEDLGRFSAREGGTGRALIATLLESVARALLQFHDRSLVHGDLRPANMLCSSTPEGPMLKLIDGGVTHPQAESSPSQLVHLRRHDLRSVGASFYLALTGKVPDRAIEPRRWNPEIPSWINRLILRLLIPYAPGGVGNAEMLLEEILRQSRSPGQLRRVSIALSKPPILGRGHELSVIQHRIDQTVSRARRPGVLLLSGETGSGKSGLLREAQVYARARGADFISSRVPGGYGLPYEPILQITQSIAALHGWSTSFLTRVSRTPRQLADWLVRLLRRAALRKPCVIAIDDAQTIAADEEEVIQSAIRTLLSTATPVLFLLGLRGDTSAQRWGETVESQLATTLSLGGLDLEAATTLIRLAVGLPPEESLVRRLHVLTGGNPGLLLTSLELLRNRFRKEGSTVGIRSLDSLLLPRDARRAAEVLVGGLEPELLRAARTLSVHPGFLKESICLEVLDDPRGPELLQALGSRGVLRRISLHTYEWASTAIRHELSGGLGARERAKVHSRFAKAGRRFMRPGILTTHLFQAYHLARTGQPERAFLPALDSAHLLSGVSRYAESADYFDLALRFLPPTRSSSVLAVLDSLQRVCRMGGLHRRGRAVSLELLRRRPTLAQYAAASHFIRMVDGPKAEVAFINQALLSRCRRSPAGLALLLSRRASAQAISGRVPSALRSARQAELYLRECKDPGAVAADVQMDLGSLHFHRGDLALASRYFLEALGQARAAGDPSREAALCDNVSLTLRARLRLAPALRYARRSLSLKLRQGLVLDSAVTRMVLGALLDDLGEHEAGQKELLQARQTFRARGESLRQAWATYGIGAIHLALEQHSEAFEWFNRALAEAPKDTQNGLALAACGGKVQVHLATGDLGKAEDSFLAGSRLLHPGVAFEARMTWLRARMLLALSKGRWAQARATLRAAFKESSRSGIGAYPLQFRLIGLMIDRAQGSSRDLLSRIEALTKAIEPTGLRPLLCEAELLGAEWAVQVGDRRRARYFCSRADLGLQRQPQPSFHIRRGLLQSQLAVSHAEQIREALGAFRLATKHELRALCRAAALQLARTYEAREDYTSALKYYQEAGNDAGNRTA